MSENPHYESASQALAFLEDSRGSYVDPTTQALTTARVEATLALAYEQRTANLIAFLGTLGADDTGIRTLRLEIVERLGLT